MSNQKYVFFISLFVILIISFFVFVGNINAQNCPCDSSGSGDSTGCDDSNFTKIGGVCFPMNTGLSSAPVSTILSNIFLWLMGIFTGLSIMAFIISGIQYLTSTGDESQIETAKRNAKYSLIGVVVGLSGVVIFRAIAAALSGNSYFF